MGGQLFNAAHLILPGEQNQEHTTMKVLGSNLVITKIKNAQLIWISSGVWVWSEKSETQKLTLFSDRNWFHVYCLIILLCFMCVVD